MATNLNFVLLHGFFGSSADFDPIRGEILSEIPHAKIWAPDFFESHSPLSPNHSFTEWADNFHHELSHRFNNQPVTLLGYSLGGRLGLHGVVKFPQLFSRAIFLSTNPGWLIETSQDRERWEQQWSAKFLELGEEQLLKAWNEQAVFHSSRERTMVALTAQSRPLLAKALSEWSLLKHEFTWNDLKQLRVPTYWWFGAEDKKFLSVKEALNRHNVPGDQRLFDGAGHRLIFDVPKDIAKELCDLVVEGE